MIRWPDFFSEQRQAQVHVEWHDAKELFTKLKQIPTVPIQTVLLGCGLSPVLVFLKIVRVMIEGQLMPASISFDDIRSAKDQLLVDFVYEAWREIGFDREGRSLPMPVTGPVLMLRPEALAQIQELPMNSEIQQELRVLAGLLAGERASSEPLPAMGTAPGLEPATAFDQTNSAVRSNKDRLEAFCGRMQEKLEIKIFKRYISLIAGYKTDGQLLRFERDDDGVQRPRRLRTTKRASPAFEGIMKMSPEEFLNALERMAKLHPEVKRTHPELKGRLNQPAAP